MLIPSLTPDLFSPNPANKKHLLACSMTLSLPFILDLMGTKAKREQEVGIQSMKEQQLYN